MTLSDFMPWNWGRRASVGASTKIGAIGDEWLAGITGAKKADSNVEVSHDSILKVSAVIAASRLISTSMASLPGDVYQRRDDGGKDRLHAHPVSKLLRHRANPIQPAYLWREAAQWQICTWGNTYSRIERAGNGTPRELWLLKPERMEDVQLRQIGGRKRLVYMYRENDSDKSKTYFDEEILHIPWTGPTGLAGFDPVSLGTEVFGSALATQQHAQEYFANGATPSALLKYPGWFATPEARKRFRDSWRANTADWKKKWQMLVLEGGMDYQQMAINPQLSQLIESRNFSVTDVARFYGVPPHLIADLMRSTNNNIEQQSLEMVTYCLLGWTTRWESVLEMSLLSEQEIDDGLFIEFNLMGLLRGDSIARSQYYREMRYIGAMNADEIRALENMNPIPDGKGQIYWQPVNMFELGQEPPSIEPSGGDDEEGDAEDEEPAEDEPEENSRELRSARAKHRISAAFRPVMVELYGRVVKRERQDIEAQIKKRLQQRGADDFRAWLEEYYRRDMREWLAPLVLPAYLGVDEAVRQEIAEELRQNLLPAHQVAAQRYADALARQYSAASLGQLGALLRESDPEAALTARMGEWGDKKAVRWGRRESVSAVGAFTVETYRDHGVQRLRWMAIGKSCPYCQQMTGRTVATGDGFMYRGDTLAAEGKPTIRIRRKTTHPPIHGACDCALVAG